MNEQTVRVGVSPRTFDECVKHRTAPLPAYLDLVQLDDGGAQAPGVEIVWRRQWDRTSWLVGRLDHLPDLRWVHTDTAGVDRLPLQHLARLGVQLSNARGAHTPAVAEWALGAMLHVARDLSRTVVDSAERRWGSHHEDVQLRGRTVMVLGLGDIGRYLAALCTAVGMRVIGVSRSGATASGVEVVPTTGPWRESLPETSFLINCLPLTPETRALIGHRVLAALAQPGWFINVGRGETVVEAGLVAALHSRALQGAVLDTVVEEPLPPSSELWGCPGILISPHASAFTDATERRTRELFCAELENHRAGGKPHNLIDLHRGY